MGYDLESKNNGSFHFGAFTFPVLLDACGYLWPCIGSGSQWYCVWGADSRMPDGDDYPRLRSNDGFEVTEEEAKIMARVARNFVAIQRSLPETHRGTGTADTQVEFKREDIAKSLMKGMFGGPDGPWPRKVRDDFVDRFEEFAEWAEDSGGFAIW